MCFKLRLPIFNFQGTVSAGELVLPCPFGHSYNTIIFWKMQIFRNFIFETIYSGVGCLKLQYIVFFQLF